MSEIVTTILGILGLVISAILGVIGTVTETRDKTHGHLTKSGKCLLAGIVAGLLVAVSTEVIKKRQEIDGKNKQMAEQARRAEEEAQRFARIREDFQRTSEKLGRITNELGDVRTATSSTVSKLETVEKGMEKSVNSGRQLHDQTKHIAERIERLSGRFGTISFDVTFAFPLSPERDRGYIDLVEMVEYPLPFFAGPLDAQRIDNGALIPGTVVEKVGAQVSGRKNLPPVKLNISKGSPFFPARQSADRVAEELEGTIFRLRELMYNSTIHVLLRDGGDGGLNPIPHLEFSPVQRDAGKVGYIDVPGKRVEVQWEKAEIDPHSLVRKSNIVGLGDFAGKILRITVYCPPFYAYLPGAGSRGDLSERVKLSRLNLRFDGLHLQFDESQLHAMPKVTRSDRVWSCEYRFPSTADEVMKLVQ